MQSVFGDILAEVIARFPSAEGAVFADWEGEAVDDASRIGETWVRLLGAHWGIVFYQARSSFSKLRLGAPVEMSIRLSERSILVMGVTSDYFVVASTATRDAVALRKALLTVRERLRAEM